MRNYFACPQLFSAINFVEKGVSFCCKESRSLHPILALDKTLDIDEFIEFRRRSIALFKKNSMFCAKLCEHVTENEWPTEFSPISLITINHFRKCNCRCFYCEVKDENTYKYSALESIKMLKANHLLAENVLVAWGGGEVTIYNDFEAEAFFCMENGYKTLVHTNGILYSAVIAETIKAGGDVWLSPDSGTPETYMTVKGVNQFKRVEQNIIQYASLGRISLKYIVNEYNCNQSDMDGFVNLCKRAGNVLVYLSLTKEEHVSKAFQQRHFEFLSILKNALENEHIEVVLFKAFFGTDAEEFLNKTTQKQA